jgi:hypothetical protein
VNSVVLPSVTRLESENRNAAAGALSIFRTVGRFSWLLYYVVFAAGVAATLHLLPKKWAAVTLATLAVVQFVELSRLRAGVRITAAERGARAAPLDDPAWRAIRARHQHLLVLPAWQCGPARSPGGDAGYATFGLLAVREHLTINSYYASRYDEKKVGYHCALLPDQVRRSGPSPDTAYVLDDAWAAWFRANVTTHECRVADGFNLCVRSDRAGPH